MGAASISDSSLIRSDSNIGSDDSAFTCSCRKDCFPQQDTGVIIGVTDAAENISFKAMMQRVQREIADIVRKDPDVRA